MSETTHQIVLMVASMFIAVCAFGLGWTRGSRVEIVKHLATLKRYGAFMDATKAEIERMKKDLPTRKAEN